MAHSMVHTITSAETVTDSVAAREDYVAAYRWMLLARVLDEKLAGELGALIGEGPDTEWDLLFSDRVLRMAVFVSKDPACLYAPLATGAVQARAS